jgi:hypothetical protein
MQEGCGCLLLNFCDTSQILKGTFFPSEFPPFMLFMNYMCKNFVWEYLEILPSVGPVCRLLADLSKTVKKKGEPHICTHKQCAGGVP